MTLKSGDDEMCLNSAHSKIRRENVCAWEFTIIQSKACFGEPKQLFSFLSFNDLFPPLPPMSSPSTVTCETNSHIIYPKISRIFAHDIAEFSVKLKNKKTIRFRRKKQAHTSHGLYFCNNFLTLNYYDFFFIRQILFCIFHSFSFYKIQSHHHRKSIKKGLFCLKIRLLWTSTQDLSAGTRRRLAALIPSVELFGWHLEKTESTSIRVLQADDRSTRTRNVLHCSES